jgi:ribonuclease P protein component
MTAVSAKFPKAEKLCGRHDIATLMAQGRRGARACIRYCCLVTPLEQGGNSPADVTPADCARVMVSVPKKHFKRAVRRNLLKRRIREAWRLQKALLLERPAVSGGAVAEPPRRYDILFTYTGDEIVSYGEIASAVAAILNDIRQW